MSSRVVILGLVVLLVGASGFLLLSTTSVTPEGRVRVMHTPTAAAACREDDCLPEFSVQTLDGQTVSNESLRGKTVLVNFWATWCAPCIRELPALEAFWKAHRGEDLVVLGISADREKSEAEVKAFLAEHGVSFPVVMMNQSIERSLGYPGLLPTSYLYGPDGHLRNTWQRALSEADLEAARPR